jgi:transcription elongation factor GreB
MLKYFMSKAFTRESDELAAEPGAARPISTLPPGVKNYMTSEGAQRLRDELEHLVQQRPVLLAEPDSSERKRQLQILEQRMAQLQQSLGTAVVIPRPEGQEDHVKFGATVTVRTRGGEEDRYRIVGVDEMDIDRGWISFLSPIARALMNAQTGQRVPLKLPSGLEELEILRIAYE